MALAPVHVYGPVQDTANDTDIAYTFGGGESVPAGHSLVLYTGSTGGPTTVIQSVADTQGNIYVVAGVNGQGAIESSIAVGTILVPLAAGDVITVTFGHTATDKQLLIHELSGAMQVNQVDPAVASNGLGGVGSNTPNASTSPTQTSQAKCYIGKITSWNGNATLIADSSYTNLYSGHFDDPGDSLIKQMNVGYKIVNAQQVVAVTEQFASGATQGWAIVAFALKEDTSPAGGTAKVVPRGLSTRGSYGITSGITKPPNGYNAVYPVELYDLAWKDIQPNDTNSLDATLLAKIISDLDAAQAAGKQVMLRFFSGLWAPQWQRDKVGQFTYADPYVQAGQLPTPKPVIKFWTAQSISDYDRVQQLLGNALDGHPALRAVFLGLAMTFYPEQMIRGVGDSRNRAEYMGGGNGWAGTFIDVPGAGYTDAANQAAVKAGIDIHAARWPTTPGAMSFNPYQQLTDYATWKGADDSKLTITKQMIDYFVASLAGTKRCILANNSVRESFWDPTGALITTTKQGMMYVYMVSKKVPRHYQAATPSRVGDPNFTLARVVDSLLANTFEPAQNSGSSPYDVTNMGTWNTALLTNPIPLIDAYAPVSTSSPIISVSAGNGFSPLTTLRTTLGTWDGGPNAITSYQVKWWRIDPLTGDHVGSALRTQSYSNKAATDDYTLVGGDVGYQIVAEVTATNVDGTSDVEPSDPTITIVNTAPPPNTVTVLPILTPAVPVAGDVLTATAGNWTGDPAPISYQYAFDRSPDNGVSWETVQVGPSGQYATSLTDKGYLFRVEVVAFNGSPSSPAISIASAAVTASPVITITSPASLQTVISKLRSTRYTIAGSVTLRGGVGLSTLTVGGVAVVPDANLGFSHDVIVGEGTNVYDVVATDQNANVGTVQVTLIVPLGTILISGDVADIELRIHQRGLEA